MEDLKQPEIKEPTLEFVQSNLEHFERLYARFEKGEEKYVEAWLNKHVSQGKYFWFWDRNKRIKTEWKRTWVWYDNMRKENVINSYHEPNYGEFVKYLRSIGYWLQGINYYYVIFKEADTPLERLFINSRTLEISEQLKRLECIEESKKKEKPEEYMKWIEQQTNNFSKWTD